MNNKLLVLGLAASILLSGCGAKKQETAESTITSVEVAAVARGTIKNDYVYSGQISALESTNVSSKMAGGKVLSVIDAIGKQVHKGQVLYTLDTTDILNNIRSLNAQLNSAEEGIRAAQAGVKAAEVNGLYSNGSTMQTQITSARATVEQLRISLQSAEKNYKDNKALYDKGYISKQILDQYENAYNQALIAYNQAEKSLSILEKDSTSENNERANASLQQANAALEQAKASKKSILTQIENLQSSLNDAVVKSPIDGVVTECNLIAGAVMSSATVRYVVSNISKVTMDVNVSEQNINSLSLGQKVNVEIATLPDTAITGEISTINPVADAVTGTYAVRITIDNPDKTLKPGMFGQVHFVKEQNDNAIIVDRNAVLGSGSEKYVFVEEDGVARKINVTTGIDNGKEIEITSGLTDGQKIIVKGQTFVKDGDPVEAVAKEE